MIFKYASILIAVALWIFWAGPVCISANNDFLVYGWIVISILAILSFVKYIIKRIKK